jgi:cytidylate kinase
MTRPSSSVSKLVEANMTRWLEREKLDKKIAERSSQNKLGPFLVVSRQCGAGGEEIAALTGQRLGWDLVDREIIENIAKDFKVSEGLVEFVDERHVAWLTEMFQSFLECQSFCQEGYIKDLGKLMMIAAQHGKFVMVGRGSQFILPREFGLFVRFRAPLEYRVARIMKSKGLSEKAAKEFVTKTEQDRTKFLKTYFDGDGSDPDLYDLTIDTSRFEPEPVAELIETAIKLRTNKTN